MDIQKVSKGECDWMIVDILILVLIAGSDFNEVSFGEFSRANDDHDEEKTRLTLPHSLPRRMVANVSISKMGKLDHQSDMGPEVIMGMSEEVDEKSRNGK